MICRHVASKLHAQLNTTSASVRRLCPRLPTWTRAVQYLATISALFFRCPDTSIYCIFAQYLYIFFSYVYINIYWYKIDSLSSRLEHWMDRYIFRKSIEHLTHTANPSQTPATKCHRAVCWCITRITGQKTDLYKMMYCYKTERLCSVTSDNDANIHFCLNFTFAKNMLSSSEKTIFYVN